MTMKSEGPAVGSDRNVPWEALIEAARAASGRAYAPYSEFAVGAALLTASGKVYTGCNVENASFSMTLCAERTAVFKAVSEGECTFRALVVFSSIGATPCGACRQVLCEFSEDLPVMVIAADQERRLYRLSELLPEAFTPGALQSAKGK